MIDDGAPGTWADMLANSPCLKVSYYPGDQVAKADGVTNSIPAASPPFRVAGARGAGDPSGVACCLTDNLLHDGLDSPKGQHDHVA